MYVGVREIADCCAGAQLVMQDAPSVFECMYNFMFLKQGQNSKYAGFVHGYEFIFQVSQAHGVCRFFQGFENKNPVGGRFYAFLFKTSG